MHVCVRVRVCACAHLHFCILLGCHDAHICVPCLLFHIHSCIHFHRHAAVYMCSVALHRPVCLTQHILRSLSRPPPHTHPPTYPPSLFLFSLTLTPSSPSRSAWLARTCMSVDSVLCLLPWHAPTSLQCSPVCINWQRDSGYVVCRAGRIEKRKKGGGDAGGTQEAM